MSAENQVTPTPTPAADPGPQEIVFAHEPVVADPPVQQADVTDVEVKEPATPQPESAKEPEQDADDTKSQRDEKGRFKGGVQDRFDELTRARREAERDAAYWKARAEGSGKAQNPAQPATPKPPAAEDFPTPEAFNEAMIDYKVDLKLNEKMTQQQAESKAHTEISERAAEWQGRLKEARAAIQDFDAVLDSSEVLVAPYVSDLLIDHEKGALILHHLAQNPEVGEKLNGMSVTKAANELAKIASGFAPAPAPEPKVVNKPTTTAPAPIKPIGSGRTTTPSVEDMTMDDYVKMRKSQGASWAR